MTSVATKLRLRLRMLAVSAASLIMGCAVSHTGRTIGQGNIQIEGSLGGPLVTNLGPAIPIPNLPVGVRYGVKDRIDVASHINALPIIMGGFMQWDASATFAIYKHKGDRGFNLGGGPGFAFFTDFKDEARIAPTADLIGGYTHKRFTTWAGSMISIDPWSKNVYLDPQIGAEMTFGRWSPSFAFVYWHPAHNWETGSLRYVGANHQGGVGFLFGLKYCFSTDKAERSAQKEQLRANKQERGRRRRQQGQEAAP